jgi:hypothetical protein
VSCPYFRRENGAESGSVDQLVEEGNPFETRRRGRRGLAVDEKTRSASSALCSATQRCKSLPSADENLGMRDKFTLCQCEFQRETDESTTPTESETQRVGGQYMVGHRNS